jgi:hypothetical protein
MSSYSEIVVQLKTKLAEVVKQSKEKDVLIYEKDFGLNYFKEQIAVLKGKIEFYQNKREEKPSFDLEGYMKSINDKNQQLNGYSNAQIKSYTDKYRKEFESIQSKKQ